MSSAAGAHGFPAAADPPEVTSLPFGAFGHDELERHIVAKGRAQAAPLEILEAGCGRTWPFSLEGVQYRITGVDLDAAALAARKEQRRDLDEAIVADIRTVRLDRKFDVISSFYVLEHVENVRLILERFVGWLADDGLLVLQIPDRDSLYGLLVRLMPFRLHVLYKKYVAGVKKAGQPGFAPYPTVYEKDMGLDAILAFARERGLRVEYVYATRPELATSRMLNKAIYAALGAVHVLTRGYLRGDRVNLAIVLSKPRDPR